MTKKSWINSMMKWKDSEYKKIWKELKKAKIMLIKGINP